MRKANEILFEEQLQQIEADLRDELEDELERLKKSLWRGRKDYFVRRCYRLRRGEQAQRPIGSGERPQDRGSYIQSRDRLGRNGSRILP